jgi:hypothetical protein
MPNPAKSNVGSADVGNEQWKFIASGQLHCFNSTFTSANNEGCSAWANCRATGIIALFVSRCSTAGTTAVIASPSARTSWDRIIRAEFLAVTIVCVAAVIEKAQEQAGNCGASQEPSIELVKQCVRPCIAREKTCPLD